MQIDDLETAIRKRTRKLLQQSASLCASRHAALPDPEIRFDLHGQAAGQFRWRTGERPVLRFNLGIARNHPMDFLATTVTHEVAHLVTAACHGRTRPHGAEWRAVMAFLGIDEPRRCHDYPLAAGVTRQQRRWRYRCDCRDHQLSTTRHNRMGAGTVRYHCRACGSVLRRVAAAEPAAAGSREPQ